MILRIKILFNCVEAKDVACTIFNIRNGKVVGKRQLKLSIEEDESIASNLLCCNKILLWRICRNSKRNNSRMKPYDDEDLVSG